MLAFLVLTAVTFSLLGFIIGIWADNFEKLQIVPLLVITPLTFLGGTFYSIHVLPPFWQKVTLFNPVVYLISGFRWSFFEIADVNPAISFVMTLVFLGVCLGHRLVDLPHRLQAEELADAGRRLIARPVPRAGSRAPATALPRRRFCAAASPSAAVTFSKPARSRA